MLQNKNKDSNYDGIFLPKNLIINSELNYNDKLIYMEIVNRCKEIGHFDKSNNYLCSRLNMINCSVAKCLEKLEMKKYIQLDTEFKSYYTQNSVPHKRFKIDDFRWL